MGSPIKKARFGEFENIEFIKLRKRLGLKDEFGAESRTLKKAVILANLYLDIKDKMFEV